MEGQTTELTCSVNERGTQDHECSDRLPVTICAAWPEYVDAVRNPHEFQAARGWHSVIATGSWDSDKMVRDLPLMYSDMSANLRKTGELKWWNLTFQLQDGTRVSLQRRSDVDATLRLWAPSPNQARSQFAMLRKCYLCKRRRRKTEARIAVVAACPELETRTISVSVPVRNRRELELNYGSEFVAWSDEFVAALKSQGRGLSIFTGPVGVGKTTYIKFLSWVLAKTHRFFYLPANLFGMLAGPKAVDFWLKQSAVLQNLTKVVVLEDAEALLIDRNHTNDEISQVLNATDGFLPDAIRVHFLFTTNSSTRVLDSAVLRPGRLIAKKEFRRLSFADAKRLADSKGISLTPRESYSLAELYNSGRLDSDKEAPRLIGFGRAD